MQEPSMKWPQESRVLQSKEQLAILLTFQYLPKTGNTVFDIANRYETLSPRCGTRDGWAIFRDAIKDGTQFGVALAQTGFFDPEIASILSVVQELEYAPKAAVEYLSVVVHRTGSYPHW